MRFDFNIKYIKGTLNKVADVLSKYYEHNYWTNVPELHDYVNACKGGSGGCLVPHMSEYDVMVFSCTVGNV